MWVNLGQAICILMIFLKKKLSQIDVSQYTIIWTMSSGEMATVLEKHPHSLKAHQPNDVNNF